MNILKVFDKIFNTNSDNYELVKETKKHKKNGTEVITRTYKPNKNKEK